MQNINGSTPAPAPNFRTLDLNLLRVFDAVMAERQVTRAATRLALTQSAVSNALRRLREALGYELFVAHRAGIQPTARALDIWPAVRDALERMQDALAPAAFDPRTMRRTFTLGMPEVTSALLLPPLAWAAALQASAVHLRALALTTRDPRAQLERGELDLALGFFPDVQAALAAHGGDGPMQFAALYSSEYVVIMRRGHPLARSAILELDEFCAADHVRVSFTGRPSGFVDDALAPMGRERRVLVTASHFYAALRLVQRSDLLAVMPRSFVQASGQAARLAVRRPPFTLPALHTGMLWHRRHALDGAHRWLRARVQDAAAEVARDLATG
jgi:DNA-binding transcriptional LysR family regulator